MSREAFGPNLRRIRIQRGVSVEAIAEATRVSPELWEGLERNDLSRWPSGIFARAYVRQYAEAVGLDPDATVDEFCRCFVEGDRRGRRVMRDHAAIVGHRLHWRDDLIGLVVRNDRRAQTPSKEADVPLLVRSQRARIAAAAADLFVVAGVGLAMSALLPIGRMTAIGVCALLYHFISLAAIGCTPAVWAIDTYVISRHPSAGNRRFLRLVRDNVRVKV